MKTFGNSISLACLLAVVSSALVAGQLNAAVVHVEVGDAGDLPGTAQPTGTGSLSSIQGTLLNSIADFQDIDMFAIIIPNLTVFSATTVSGQTEVEDTQLFLFDAYGMGVGANDDAGLLLNDATIGTGTLSGPAGLYYLAVSSLDDVPTSSLGEIFPDLLAFEGQTAPPTGPGHEEAISGWKLDEPPFSYPSEVYEILLEGAEGAPIPEPVSFVVWSLTGLAFAGIMRLRRSRR